MPSETVIAVYRPKAGMDGAMREILTTHVANLRAWGFASSRPVTLLRASDGAYIEIFEWLDGAAERAHHDARVQEMWGRFAAACDFAALKDLPGAAKPFAHFTAVDGVTI